MNFDLNMMSTLMQLLSNNQQGKQQPFDLLKSFAQNPNRQNVNTYASGNINNEHSDAKNASAWQDDKKEQSASTTSEFANINGIGTKVDINFDVNLGTANQPNQNNNTRNVYPNDDDNTNSAFYNTTNNTNSSQFANIFSQFASNAQNNQNTNGVAHGTQTSAQYTQSNTQSGQNDTAQNSFGATDDSANNHQSSQNFDASVLSQNPMFALLKMMQSPKKDVNIMSMLPTLMSLLKPKTASQQNKTNTDADNSNRSNNSSNDSTANVDKNTDADKIENNIDTDSHVEKNDKTDFENEKNENSVPKRKTQSDFFSPIAFAGYELVSSLCKLYLSTKRAV